jgi:hypothetical protein
LAATVVAIDVAVFATEPAVSALPLSNVKASVWSSTNSCKSARAASVAIPSVFLFTYSTTVLASVPSGKTPTKVSNASTSS